MAEVIDLAAPEELEVMEVSRVQHTSKATGGFGMGWLPDFPDFRDYTPEHQEVAPLLQKTAAPSKDDVPSSVDLRQWCPPVEDQGSLGSCTAQSGVALVEYFTRRALGTHLDGSRLFLYKATRNLMKAKGDTGAYLRSTMGAMRLFGVPPEDFWPYNIAGFDKEPPAFCYAFAQNYQALTFYRLDPPGLSRADVLKQIKKYLATELPAMFGFTVFTSISQAGRSGEIPYPTDGENIEGGHAVVAVGYDDRKKIKNSSRGGKTTEGAFLIRNSWGTGWGDSGYGWLPYEYLNQTLAIDWWSLIQNEWVELEQFKE